jgi:putative membrane protein
MDSYINMQNVVNSLVFSGIGILAMIVAFAVVDMITLRYNLWLEIVEKQNLALAVLLGAFLIGTALIIAAAVHG